MGSNYLEEAAELLRKASDHNERANASYPERRAEKQIALAGEFAKLAAIEKGIIPADMLAEVLERAQAKTPRP
jgi:hypothetical protein